MVKALIFDVDGTLAETEEAHRVAFNRTFQTTEYDWYWSVADYTQLLKTTGGKERMRRYRNDLCAEAPGDPQIAQMHQLKTEIYSQIVASGELKLRPGVRALIDQARTAGLRLAIATTTNRPNVEALCQACWGCKADEIFEVIAAGDEVASKKPAPDVFDLAVQKLGLTPEECIAFEDSYNGLSAAKSAGLRVVVTPSEYTAAEDFSNADWLLPDLAPSNLPDVLAFPPCDGRAGQRGKRELNIAEPIAQGVKADPYSQTRH